MKPMLADQIKVAAVDDIDGELLRWAADDEWWFEQKLDGHRLLVTIDDGTVTFRNRQGEAKTTLPAEKQLSEVFAAFSTGQWCFDGEYINGTLWLFDLPYAGSQVDVHDRFDYRRTVLEAFYQQWAPPSDVVALLPTFRTENDKAAMAADMRASGREGVIAKKIDGIYQPGKRSASTLKAKFYNTIDVVVGETAIDGKENAELCLWHNDPGWLKVGKCSTIGKPAVEAGDVIEVKYLYAVDPDAPRLYQPTILQRRDDKTPPECTPDQLIFTNKEVLA